MRTENIRKKHTQEEIKSYETELRETIKKGDNKVYCVLRGVSRSGMTRYIDFYTFIANTPEEIKKGYGAVTKIYLTYRIGVVLDYPLKTNGVLCDSGLKVEGCGQDMGFSVVSHLSGKLYPKNDRGEYKISHEWV